MSRLQPNRQQGFGLLVFVIMASTIALSIVLGYSGLLTRQVANELPAKLKTELAQATVQVEGYYQANARAIDGMDTASAYTADAILSSANVSRRRGLKAAISNVLVGADGINHRRFVLYFPSATDELNPPNLQLFLTTGEFVGCSNTAADCTEPPFVVIDSLTLHRDALLESRRRLERVAFKAQAYFKARMLQDPEKNISVNYFRPPYGADLGVGIDMPILEAYEPVVSLNGSTGLKGTRLPAILGLSPDEMYTAWGDPIEASNGVDSEKGEPPYTMVFRGKSPFGGYFFVRAIQQI